jgi:sugar lactone lactonase YvrE
MRQIKRSLSIAVMLTLGFAQLAKAEIIHKNLWDFDRSLLEWRSDADKEKAKAKGEIKSVPGWIEYDFDVAESGWHELWMQGAPSEWTRDISLDGAIISRLHIASKLDVIQQGQRRGWCKEFNLYLKAGKHSLRYRRLGFPAWHPKQWELIPAAGNPFASITANILGHKVMKLGDDVSLEISGGMPESATSYELLARHEASDETTPLGRVEFPASQTPVTKTVRVRMPAQGSYLILGKVGDQVSRPADLNAGRIVAIDTQAPPAAGDTLQKSVVVDIDCTAERQDGFWEKDGKTRVVKAPLGAYRESSGNASNDHWALDGFSYSFDLPAADQLYQLEVSYPDNDRRTMGFWINDGVTRPRGGVTLCGGVEAGDRYRLSNRMQTHQAFFFPRSTKDLVVAVLNLSRGCRAAAGRIRIYRIDGSLPAAPISQKRSRLAGYYFEEPGRWLRHFGGGLANSPLDDQIKTMERWGQWNRYIGANLMFPTINVYQGNHYPSDILEGYFNRPTDECRLNALVAEKYGCQYIPEFHLSGQTWFEKHVMGVWTEKEKVTDSKGKVKTETTVKFRSSEAEQTVLVSQEGQYHCSWKPFVYNALHPTVQEKYISVLGELADRLGDTESFAGISSRLMLSWQWMGWNALPGLKWGYGDWTIAQFEKDTGINVPGDAGKADRFEKRYAFLTGAKRSEWVQWRCDRMLDFYRRMRDRIRQAKPTANLILPWHGPDKRAVLSENELNILAECGIKWQDIKDEPGIMIIPGAMYGRRFSTPVSDARKEDNLYAEEFKAICRTGDRGAMLYSDYFEVNKHLKWEELGGKPGYNAFDCTTPGGVNERELVALIMADSDCSLLVNGGNGWFFGTPDVMTPFLKEFRALPAKPFIQSKQFRDPVAVWHLQDGDEFFFYAVNRLPTPVTVKLKLDHAGKVVSASTGDEISGGFLGLGNTITFELPGYMMRAFKTSGRNASIADVKVDSDSTESETLAPMMRFAEQLLDDLRDRRVAVELSKPDADTAIKLLSEALAAFEEGRLWQAKGNLRRESMVRIYDMTGAYPPGLYERTTPHGLVAASTAPELVFSEESDIIGDARGKLSAIQSLSCDANGNILALSPEQLMTFAPDGTFLRSARLLGPHTPDQGGTRWGNLTAPSYASPDAIRILQSGNLAAMGARTPLYIYDSSDFRLIPRWNSPGLAMPGKVHQRLAEDADGNLYIGCVFPKNQSGVWKYKANGDPAYEFATPDGQKTNRLCPVTPEALAIDRENRIYVAAKSQIKIYSPSGKLVDTLDEKMDFSAMVITPDGQTMFAASGRYGSVSHFVRNAKGRFTKVNKTDTPGSGVTALALNKTGNELIIGYDKPVNGAVAVKRAITATGLGESTPLIKGQADTVLNGFTQIKTYQGQVYYLNRNTLMKLAPGGNTPVPVHEFKVTRTKIESFAFTPKGDLYLASNDGFFHNSRGTNVYLAKKTTQGWAKPEMINNGKPLVDNAWYQPTDLAVDNGNHLYIRHYTKQEKSANSLSIYRLNSAGKIERFGALGSHSHLAPKIYGLHIDAKSGNVYVAGGSNRVVACYNSEGKQLWQTGFDVAQGPGSVPLRNVIGIATDSRGNVWVTDPSANRILCLDKDGKFLKSFGHFGNVEDRDGRSFCNPVGIAAVTDGNGQEWLYVADVNNQRIVRYKIQR